MKKRTDSDMTDQKPPKADGPPIVADIEAILAGNEPDPKEIEAIVADYTADLAPANPVETGLVQELALARYHLSRIQAIETDCFDLAMQSVRGRVSDPGLESTPGIYHFLAFERLSSETNALKVIERHEDKYQKSYDRALSRLRSLQSQRRLQESTPSGGQRRKEKAQAPKRPAGVAEVVDIGEARKRRAERTRGSERG